MTTPLFQVRASLRELSPAQQLFFVEHSPVLLEGPNKCKGKAQTANALVRKGYLLKTDGGLYQLTDRGGALASNLAAIPKAMNLADVAAALRGERLDVETAIGYLRDQAPLLRWFAADCLAYMLEHEPDAQEHNPDLSFDAQCVLSVALARQTAAGLIEPTQRDANNNTAAENFVRRVRSDQATPYDLFWLSHRSVEMGESLIRAQAITLECSHILLHPDPRHAAASISYKARFWGQMLEFICRPQLNFSAWLVEVEASEERSREAIAAQLGANFAKDLWTTWQGPALSGGDTQAPVGWCSLQLAHLCDVWDTCGDRAPHLMLDGLCPLPERFDKCEADA